MTRYTTSTTVTAPSDGTYSVGCWGGGGGGSAGAAGNGGGGGAFSFASVPVTAGQVLTVTIGAGGGVGVAGGTTTVAIGASVKCSAFGGSSPGAGGTTGGVGTTKFAGGLGGVGDTFTDTNNITYQAQGGGGGSAGRGGAGGPGGSADAQSAINGDAGAGNTSYTGNNWDGADGGSAALSTAASVPGGGGRGAAAGAGGAAELVFASAAEAAPVISPTTATFSQPENQAFSQDYDADNAVTWSISSGTDAAKFSIDANGTLTLPAKNFEAPDDSNTDNVYACTIRAANVSNGTASTKAITVTITNVVDETPPTITTSATQTCPENQQLAVALTADETISAWALAGGVDASQFQIAGTTLQWAANGAKDYEAPTDSDTDNAYQVTVQATDTSGNVTTKAITVTVTDVTGGDIANTGLKLPSAGADTGGGTFAWTNPGNVQADDAAYAVASSNTASVTSNVLSATGFDLSAIPDAASIVGLEVLYEAQGTTGSGGKTATPSVQIKGTGTTQSGPAVSRTSALTVYTLGGPTDTWGLTGANLIGAGLKSSFAVNMQAAISSGSGTATFQLDYIKVRVYYVAPIALNANSTVVGSPTNGTPLLRQVHGLGASSIAPASPALGVPLLGQAHALVANSVTTASPVIGNRIPDPGFEAGIPTIADYADGGATGISLITGGAQSGSNYLRMTSIGGHQFNLPGTFVAAGRSALLSVWLKDSGLAGTWGVSGYPDQPHGFGLWLTTQAAPTTPGAYAGSGQLQAQATAGSGWTLYSYVVTGLVPGTTYYIVAQTNYYTGSRQVDVDYITVSDVALGQVHGLAANSTVTSSPALGTPTLGQVHVLIASSVTPSSPVLGTPTMGQIYALGANSTTTGPPVLGTPTLGQVTNNLTANSTTTSSPALGTPALGQKHALSVNGTTTASPAVGTPALGQGHALTATGTTTSAPTLGTPAIGQKHSLTANSTAPAFPAMATPVLTVIPSELVKVRPASVVSAGGWTDNAGGSAIAAALDEAVADDADYAQSPFAPADNVLRLKLAPLNALALYQTATLRYRVGKLGGPARTQTVRMYQGATLIAGPWVHNADAVTQYSQAIDPALITDGDDLYVEVEAD